MAKALTTARAGLRRFFSISAFTPPPPATVPPPAEPSPNLFVSGLSKRTTSEGLREAFSKFGSLVDARVITDRVSGYSKGFGFVRYATVEEAAEGIKGMDGKFLDGWVIFAEYAKPRAQPSQGQSPPQSMQNSSSSAPPSNYSSQATQSWSNHHSPQASGPLPSYSSYAPQASEPRSSYSSYTPQASEFQQRNAWASSPSWNPPPESQPPNYAPSSYASAPAFNNASQAPHPTAYSSMHGAPEPDVSSYGTAPPNNSASNSETHSENPASEPSYNFDSGSAVHY